MPDLGKGSIPIVGQRLHVEGDPAGPISFVGDLLIAHTGKLAGSLFDRLLDVVFRHVGGPRRQDDRPQARVPFGIATANPGGDGDLFDPLGEKPPALGVGRTLLVLDRVPLRMSRHEPSPARDPGGILPCAPDKQEARESSAGFSIFIPAMSYSSTPLPAQYHRR